MKWNARFLALAIAGAAHADTTWNIPDIRRVSPVLEDGLGYAPAEVYETLGVRRFTEPPHLRK